MESKQLSSDDQAPRLKDLQGKRRLLLRAIREAMETREQGRVETGSCEAALGDLDNLPPLLAIGSPT